MAYITGYWKTNYSGNVFQINSTNTYRAVGQGFTLTTPHIITSVNFHLMKMNSATGPMTAKLYSVDVPNRQPWESTLIAVSDSIDISGYSNAVMSDVNFSFTGTQQKALPAGYYAVVVYYNAMGGTNGVQVGVDFTSPTYGTDPFGNGNNGVWYYIENSDVIFEVYGTPVSTSGMMAFF